jgi:hypothetical protein
MEASQNAIELAASAWTKEKTSGKIMDSDLAMEFAKIIDTVKKEYSSKPWLGNATTSELIHELSARCDIGSINQGGDYKTVTG